MNHHSLQLTLSLSNEAANALLRVIDATPGKDISMAISDAVCIYDAALRTAKTQDSISASLELITRRTA